MNQRHLKISLLSLFSILPLAAVLLGLHAPPAAAQEGVGFEGQIAYLGEDRNVWILRGTGEQVQVTTDAGEGDFNYRTPRFSSDGSLLAFCRSDYSSGAAVTAIHIIDPSTATPIQQIDDGYCGFDWSSDGSQIYFSRPFEFLLIDGEIGWDNARGLYAADIISGQVTELAPTPGKNPLVNPDASPDGKWVQFYEVVYIEGIGKFTTREQSSGNLYEFDGYGSASWAPDSSQLVFDDVTYVGFEGSGIFISSPDGGDLRKVFSENSLSASGPLWSPRGDLIAFMLTQPDTYESGDLLLMSPQGQVITRTRLETNFLIDWSPGGGRLLYTRSSDQNFGIYDLDSASSFTLPIGGYEADWAPLPEPEPEPEDTPSAPEEPDSSTELSPQGSQAEPSPIPPSEPEATTIPAAAETTAGRQFSTNQLLGILLAAVGLLILLVVVLLVVLLVRRGR